MLSRATITTRFRLATINVHSFRSALTGLNNVNDLIEILQPFDFDLIAVEEVQNDHNWKRFCQNLSLKYSIFDATYGDSHGNGFASRYPIISSSNRLTNFSSGGGKRAIVKCCLGGDHPFVLDRIFGVTHLDHVNESDRLKQMKYFEPNNQNIDILLGDMNALTREDYSQSYFNEIVRGKREESGWEKPCFDLTHLITQQWNCEDALKLIHPTIKDEQIVTCAYGTRIDYIYLRPRTNDQSKLTQCSIINTQPATDHNAVWAEFEKIYK